MQQTLKSLFSLVFLLWAGALLAQNEPPADADTVEVKKLREKYEIVALRFGTDLIPVIKSFSTPGFSGWELNSDLDIGRYYISMDVGHLDRSYDIYGGSDYRTQGNYVKLGADVNFLKKDPDRNMFFFGLRYGMSNFQESAQFVFTDPVYGAMTRPLSNNSVRGTWAELVTGLRVKVWKEFWMGFTARMKVLPSVSGDQQLVTYEIPGYGVYSEKIYWGFNYQVFWRIPFRKPSPPVEK